MKQVKTGLVYHDDFLLHTNDSHPECKERLEAAVAKLKDKNVMEYLELITPSQKTSPENIAMVHEEKYINSVKESCEKGVRQLDMDTYLTPYTYDVARLAVQGCIDAASKIMEKELSRAFALVRPPGHHAEPYRGMGFCIFNNIAVASRVLQRDYGVKRIMIVDWDVHHGNSTQHVFEEDAEVLFFSVHQSPAYPGTGGLKEVGKKDGTGYNINAPMPPGCVDEDYLSVFNEIVMPVMDEYKPEILLVSAGQDAYQGDPLASMNLTKQCYARMAELLVKGAEKHCEGKMLFFLEGGYNVDAQASIIYNVLNVISGWDFPLEEDKAPASKGAGGEMIKSVIDVQKEYWPILK